MGDHALFDLILLIFRLIFENYYEQDQNRLLYKFTKQWLLLLTGPMPHIPTAAAAAAEEEATSAANRGILSGRFFKRFKSQNIATLELWSHSTYD
jgi:hypothetical protein